MLSIVRATLADVIYPEGREERRSLFRMANVDQLTGLGNRRAFEAAMETASKDPGVVIAVFDLNNLGLANKARGHTHGDSLIRYAAIALTEVFSRVFRIGGDEFVVIANRSGVERDVERAENYFGSCPESGFEVSLSGTYGETFDEADAKLQKRKAERKQQS